MRLIEPLGLCHGPAAAASLAAGSALPLPGGSAFSLARLIDRPDHEDRLLPATDIPPDWRGVLARLQRAPPAWAGFSADRTAVMGILNVTPDSFSDGGQHAEVEAATAMGRAMAAAGADLIDIGGESTRPGSAPVAPAAEQARILPVIRALAGGPPISVDTRNAGTMAAALDAGAAIINDVSALAHDPEAAGLVAEAGCPVVLMHMRGTPQTMHEHAGYDDVAVAVTEDLAARVAAAERAGIDPAQIAIDPGFGFAKDGADNLALLRRLSLLRNLGRCILVGMSRKRFLGDAVGEMEPALRLPAALAASVLALEQGGAILRVHDVAETVQAVRLWRAVQSGAR